MSNQDEFRWIPVEEALPEDRREKVLVCGKGYKGTAEFGVGWYIRELRKWECAGGFIVTVTHWARIRMPEIRD